MSAYCPRCETVLDPFDPGDRVPCHGTEPGGVVVELQTVPECEVSQT